MRYNPSARVQNGGVRFSKDDFCNTSFFLFLFVCLFFFFSLTTFPKQISFIDFKREPFPYVQALYSVIMNIGINHCQKYPLARSPVMA